MFYGYNFLFLIYNLISGFSPEIRFMLFEKIILTHNILIKHAPRPELARGPRYERSVSGASAIAA